jgi:hypothetical protein
MALSSSNAVRQLSDGNSQGTVLGQSVTDPIGFYGLATPIAKPVIGGSASSGALASTIALALGNLGLAVNTSQAA